MKRFLTGIIIGAAIGTALERSATDAREEKELERLCALNNMLSNGNGPNAEEGV